MDEFSNALVYSRPAGAAKRRFLSEVSGASDIEFAVITALIALAAMFALTDLGSAVAAMLK